MFTAVKWQRYEAGILFLCALALYLRHWEIMPWWAALLLFFAPDISFLGYAFGRAVGAVVYNLVHLYAFGAALFTLGLLLSSPLLAALGALWLGHAGFDRMLGYGLKSREGFGVTHLGRLGGSP
ncbi:DUF4260 family protein [Thioclava sp. BHET1]|nr:DUF4260 family protein [Thioclava sp. BHET1]